MASNSKLPQILGSFSRLFFLLYYYFLGFSKVQQVGKSVTSTQLEEMAKICYIMKHHYLYLKFLVYEPERGMAPWKEILTYRNGDWY